MDNLFDIVITSITLNYLLTLIFKVLIFGKILIFDHNFDFLIYFLWNSIDKNFDFRKVPKMKRVSEEKRKYEKRCCFGYTGDDCTERVEVSEREEIELDEAAGKISDKIFTCEDFHPCTEGNRA